MNRLFSLLTLSVLLGSAQSAHAAETKIAQQPLMSITGSNTVKPNLMLLYDNSGSMNFNYTPDYVNSTDTCRAGSKMASGTRSCVIGDPPFASPDFNRQYYDPKVRYLPPVKADGTSYNELTSARTNGWRSVTSDAYGINKTSFVGGNPDTFNLLEGFNDIAWCDWEESNCVRNTVGYTYPTNDNYVATNVLSNPYYYSIGVSEYCTNNNMTNCRAATANGASPDPAYTIPARVRFCDSTALTNCQAKFVGTFKYPRFGSEDTIAPWYGTITVGLTATNTSRTIRQVTAVGPLGTQVITDDAVTAANGVDSAAKQAAVARSLAASIIARTGLGNGYYACVRTPGNSGVPGCAGLGITLPTDNVVAVLPLSCPTGNTTKNLTNCTLVKDGSRAGTTLMASSGTGATALLTISGRSNNNTRSNTQEFRKINLIGLTLLPNAVSISRNTSARDVVARLVAAIGTRGPVTAYVGGNNVSATCRARTDTTLCLVDTSGKAEGARIDYDAPTNNGTTRDPWLELAASDAVSDVLPTTTTGIGASVFVRTDIVPSRTAYPKSVGRTDCAGETCTYNDEMTNFANWYSYYRTRNQMMKTAVGQAFAPITERYQVGVVALSVAAAEGTINRPQAFEGQDRVNWYTSLYGMSTSGSTPVRQALHAIGKMYGKQYPYQQGEDAVEYACQQNFTFITTDGYWNGEVARGVGTDRNALVPSNDQAANSDRFCLQSKGCVDPREQSRASLADIALYWYNGGSSTGTTSLRSDLEDMTKPGKVPAAAGENSRLHMKTYALGLGVDGIMTYEPNYDTAPDQNGDFYKLVSNVQSGCPWNNNGPYVWPDPNVTNVSGSAALQERVDDLWHAAINGHGKYFSASDPLQVIEGLRSALSNIEVKIGAAAAAATSTPNITQSDNDIFSSTFTTVRWYGRLSKREVNVATGEVVGAEIWNTSTTLGNKVKTRAANSVDQRVIKMLNAGGTALVDFTFSNMDPTTQGWFAGKCAALTQCATMSAENRALVNNGANIVNWLRGWQEYADDNVLRAYSRETLGTTENAASVPIVLGDIASSKPAYLREPRRNFDRPGYSDFKVTHADRKPTVFAAANDGMLHAFDADDGNEMWAYVPRITMKKLHLLASTSYGDNHIFSVDGSPEVADVCVANCAGGGTAAAPVVPTWKTVLVAGLNAGGRGYYAVDVTDPENPQALWELCADAAACAGNVDARIGYSFGNPQFGTIVDGNGVEKWVVFLTSGYNNIPGTDGVNVGDGKGHLLVVDVATGRVIENRSATTGSGDVANPSGFAKISAITNDPNNDPRVTYVYGGDNSGKMWRFDYTGRSNPTVLLMGDAGLTQPITTRPEITMCRVETTVDGRIVPSAQRVVLFGTGRLLDLSDVGNVDNQSAYLLKDDGVGITAAQWRRSPSMIERTLTRETIPANADGTIDLGRARTTIGGSDFSLARDKGWFVDFKLNRGERVNLDPQVVAGTVNIVTNLPSRSNECSVGGTSNVYQLSICSGRAASPDGFAGYPLGGSAAVGFIVIRLPSGALKTVTTLADGRTVSAPFPPSETIEAHRAGWRRVFD